jgi:hypothetical protein
VQVDRALAALARRPVTYAAVLAWVWVTVVFAPVGATLHALTHLRPILQLAVPRLAASPAGDGARSADRYGAERDGASGHADGKRPAAHCHGCDAWQFLDHVLPLAAAGALSPHGATPPHAASGTTRASVEVPWILPRAPPSRA